MEAAAVLKQLALTGDLCFSNSLTSIIIMPFRRMPNVS